MFKFKKMATSLLICLTLLIYPISAFASEHNTLEDTKRNSSYNQSLQKYTHLSSGSYIIDDVEKFALENDIPLVLNGKPISKIEIVEITEDEVVINNDTSAIGLGDYIGSWDDMTQDGITLVMIYTQMLQH